MKKNISIIIPIYGKDKDFIKKNLNTIFKNTLSKNFNFIISYKNHLNNKKFNYDNLKEFESENIKIIKNSSKALRTSKVLNALKFVETKYLFVLDAHHSLNLKTLYKFSNLIYSKNYDVIFTPLKIHNLDSNKIKKSKIKFAPTAGRYVIKTKLLENINLNYDIIFHDDWSLCLYALFNSKTNPKFINSYFYIKNHGKEISETYLNKNNFDQMIKDSEKIAKYFLNFPHENTSKYFLKGLEELILTNFRRRGWRTGRNIYKVPISEKLIWFNELKTNNNFNIILTKNDEIINDLIVNFCSKYTKQKNKNHTSKKALNFDIVYSFDNLEQYTYFKKSLSSFLNYNYKNFHYIHIKIFIENNFYNIHEAEILNFLIKNNNLGNNVNDYKYCVFQIITKKTNNIFKSWIQKSEYNDIAKFYWMMNPFISSNKYTIILDNDTIINLPLYKIIESSKKRKIMQGVTLKNIFNNPKKRKVFKEYKNSLYIKRNKNKYINFGVALVNNKKFKNKFKTKENLKKYLNKKLKEFKEKNFFISDQDIMWLKIGNKFGSLDSHFNIRLHTNLHNMLVHLQDWIIHYNLWFKDFETNEDIKVDFYSLIKNKKNKKIIDDMIERITENFIKKIKETNNFEYQDFSYIKKVLIRKLNIIIYDNKYLID